MFAELLDGVEGAPVSAVLTVALSRHLLLHGVNQEVIRPQNEDEHHDPKYHELLEHVAEPTASPKFLLADYSLRQPARNNVLPLPDLQPGFVTLWYQTGGGGWMGREGRATPARFLDFPPVSAARAEL
jgi:hypothetical protein